MIIPRYLKKGDTIAITCPAGFMAAEKAQTCIETLQQWGYKVMVGKTLGSASTNYFSGTDQERADELQAMLNDPSINAILFGRGGYGMGRILPMLNFKQFKKNPKWLIGFSDITVMHTYLFSNFKIASMHAPMAAAFNDGGANNEYIGSLKKILKGNKMNYSTSPHPFNKIGSATGKLIGGNLALLAHAIGTPSDYATKNCILFIEDIGEQLYNADRMLHQLKAAGKMDKISGLIFGGFTEMKDTDRPFGKTMDEILLEISADLNIPVCLHFPVSHDTENVALKIGITCNLIVGAKKVTLKEL
ncbi:MAG: LD-carboxypeptidase [Ferruginibacter sp.]